MSSQASSSHLANLERDGFVIIRSLISPDRLEELRAASRDAEQLARSGHWPHVRVVGKQFPPWTLRPGQGIWGVQHLMHPSLPGHEEFTRLYFSSELLGVARDLLRCSDGELVMELLNMLVRPEGGDWALAWHRDDIPASATGEEETARLAGAGGYRADHAQYNLALWEDESLVVVPGSHRRARTEAERRAGAGGEMPGSVVVRLGPGDVVFYDNNVLHRGVYDGGRERMTLHGSVGCAGRGGDPGEGTVGRARNVLQHGVGEWVGEVDLGVVQDEGERRRAEAMRERLVRMGEGWEVGYSLEG